MDRAVEEKNLERAWTLLNTGLSRFFVDYRKQYDQTYNTADTELVQLRQERQHFRVQMIRTYNQAVRDGRLLQATLHAWQDAVHYDALCYQLQHRRLINHREKHHIIFDDLKTTYTQHDWSSEWRMSRLLAGKRQGPNHRRYGIPMPLRPSADEWRVHLALPGKDGGCAARE
eukprot:23115-Heterocapsa_arctica.AAC.1